MQQEKEDTMQQDAIGLDCMPIDRLTPHELIIVKVVIFHQGLLVVLAEWTDHEAIAEATHLLGVRVLDRTTIATKFLKTTSEALVEVGDGQFHLVATSQSFVAITF